VPVSPDALRPGEGVGEGAAHARAVRHPTAARRALPTLEPLFQVLRVSRFAAAESPCFARLRSIALRHAPTAHERSTTNLVLCELPLEIRELRES